MMSRTALEPAAFPFLDYRRFTFSLGIDTPRGIWLAGNTAACFDAARQRVVVAGDIAAQAEVAYAKLAASLEPAGLGLDSLARAVEYVTASAIGDYPRVGALRRRLFPGTPPAISTVVVNRLLRPEALIEVEGVAARGAHVAAGGAGAGEGPRAAARQVGDTVYLSALTAADPDTGAMPGAGDVAAQARRIYERAEAVLAAAGLGLEHVVRTSEWVTPAALPRYRETADLRRALFRPPYPASLGVVMKRLAHPEALIQIDVTASAAPREAVNPGWPRFDSLTYSPAVRAGGIVFLAGLGAVDPATGEVVAAGDVVAQTREIYRRIAELLASIGAGPDAVAKTTEYVTAEALADYRRTADIRREVFRPPYPAATGVVCDRLLRPGMVVEVEAVAVVG
jgi:enamine deaminase RidA (YjgF/YER057c/UK114 family)